MKVSQFSFLSIFILLIIFAQLTVLNLWSISDYLYAFFQIFLPALYLLPTTILICFFLDKKLINYSFSIPVAIGMLSMENLALWYLNNLNTEMLLIIWLLKLFASFFVFKKIKNLDFKIQDNNQINFQNTILLILIFCFVLITFTIDPIKSALHYPTTYDLSIFHLSSVNYYISNEGYINPHWLRGAFIPQLTHHLFTGGILWSLNFVNNAAFVPNIFSLYMFLATLIIIKNYLKFNKAYFYFFILLCLSVPIIRWHLSTAYLEPTLILFLASALYSALYYIENNKSLYLYLFCAFTSFAFCTKHFGIIYMSLILFLLIIFNWKLIKSLKIKTWLICFIIFFIPFLSFYSFNFINSKSFLFPFIFTENNNFFWSFADKLSFSNAIKNYSQSGILNLLKLPFDIGTSDLYSDEKGYSPSYIWLFIWLSNLILFAYLSFKQSLSKTEKFYFILSNSCILIWYYSSPVYRYLSFQIILMISCYFILIIKLDKKPQIIINSFAAIFILLSNSQINLYKASPLEKTESEIKSYLNEFSQNSVLRTDIFNNPIVYENKYPLTYKFLSDFTENNIVYENEVIYTLHDEGNWLFYKYPFIGDWFGPHSYDKIVNKDLNYLRSFFSSRNVRFILINKKLNVLFKNFPADLGSFSNCLKLITNFEQNGIHEIYEIQKSESCISKETLHPSVADLLQNFPKLEKLPFTNYPFY